MVLEGNFLSRAGEGGPMVMPISIFEVAYFKKDRIKYVDESHRIAVTIIFPTNCFYDRL